MTEWEEVTQKGREKDRGRTWSGKKHKAGPYSPRPVPSSTVTSPPSFWAGICREMMRKRAGADQAGEQGIVGQFSYLLCGSLLRT